MCSEVETNIKISTGTTSRLYCFECVLETLPSLPKSIRENIKISGLTQTQMNTLFNKFDWLDSENIVDVISESFEEKQALKKKAPIIIEEEKGIDELKKEILKNMFILERELNFKKGSRVYDEVLKIFDDEQYLEKNFSKAVKDLLRENVLLKIDLSKTEWKGKGDSIIKNAKIYDPKVRSNTKLFYTNLNKKEFLKMLGEGLISPELEEEKRKEIEKIKKERPSKKKGIIQILREKFQRKKRVFDIVDTKDFPNLRGILAYYEDCVNYGYRKG
jgi:hypothetical protein